MAAAHRSRNGRFDRWLRSSERHTLPDRLTDAELLAVSAGADGAHVRRAGVISTAPFDVGVSSDAVSPWDGLRALKFDRKSVMTLPGLDLTGGEPFSMAAWVYLPKIVLHPGQTGGSHALVIAGQMSAADPEAKPAVPPTGWVFEIDEGVARLRLLDRSGKVIRAQAPYHKPVKAGTWNHLTFTYDGTRTEDGYAFYLNGTRMPLERGAYGGQDSTIAPELKDSVTNTAPITLGASEKGEKGIDGAVADFRVFNRVISEEESRIAASWPAVAAASSKNRAELAPAETDALKLYYLMQRDASYQGLA